MTSFVHVVMDSQIVVKVVLLGFHQSALVVFTGNEFWRIIRINWKNDALLDFLFNINHFRFRQRRNHRLTRPLEPWPAARRGTPNESAQNED